MPQQLGTYCVIINILTFCVFGYDKYMSLLKKRRVPEKALIGLAFIGGSLGAFLAMFSFRHKTKKKLFTVCVPIFLFLQMAAAFYIAFR